MYKPNFIIITGGPGVGKTTLLEQLQQRGFPCIPEVAREIIREQSAQNGNALPWGNIPAYTRLMLSRSVDSYRENASRNEILFFDRGIPDTLAYAHLTNQPLFPKLPRACADYRYNTRVFILPPWAEIYHTDPERKQTYQEAIDTYHTMAATYQSIGYDLTLVPKATPAERADFVLRQISQSLDYKHV